ncbi:MAG: hypothetical protein Q9170_001543 [Blastenia crenularia]
MAEVLPFPSQPEGASHFGSSSLQRSSSHSSLLLSNSTFYGGLSSNPKSGYSHFGNDNRPSSSLPSSAPSSPRLSQPQFSNQPSYTSTPSSSLSLSEDCYNDDEDIHFPSYSNETYTLPSLAAELPNTPDVVSPEAITPPYNILSCPNPPKTAAARVRGSGPAGDDMDIKEEPTRHVDYLSHNWKEEDICGLSRSNSFPSKKPILKKRSLSELMLQKSISSSTLIQQATDALQAQQPKQRLPDRPVLGERALSDFVTSSNPETPSSPSNDGGTSTQPSTSTSGRQTPCTKRHIHFNNKVEQCIAINDGEHRRCRYGKAIYEDSDSEEDMLMMKAVGKKDKPRSTSTPRNSFSNESKTIAMLPSTTLKYRGDTPEPDKQKEKQGDGMRNSGFKIPQSPSQETIKPSISSTNFLLDDEDEDVDVSWQASSGRRDSLFLRRSFTDGSNSDDESVEVRNGLRRTASGMFMPYDDDDGHATTGLLGKVIDTVNTAKDIAHVIWNVGWRG